MPTTDTNTTSDTNTNNNDNNNDSSSITTDTSSNGCIYDEFGRTPDKTQVCGIGLPSASADEGSGYQKCIFENKCPQCGAAALRWGWHWEENNQTAFSGEGGNAEGHFFCYQEDGGCDADYSAQGNEHIDGSTQKLTMVSGPTPSSEEEAQKLIDGQLPCDGTSSGTTAASTGGGAVKIPDITFYGLIKQIMGAIDAEFIIANNMAYLISFKDIYEYRNQFDEIIPKIELKDVIKGSLVKNFAVDGFYNAVEVEYADGIIEYQNDDLVKQYGKNVYYYSFPEDDEETAKAKADALLSAHTRDYSTSIQLSVFFNENITEGSWVKVHKNLTKVSDKTRREIQQEELEAENGVIETKRKGINITNLTESTVTNDEGVSKKIRTITDEEGETYDIELEDTEYELFFVQGFTCRWDKNHSLIMDIELKYGPDSPDDPVNATIGTLGESGSSANGNWGNDAFTIDEICVANNKKIHGKYSGGAYVQKIKELVNSTYMPESSDYAPRANQNSNYAKKYGAMSSPEEVYQAFRSEYKYSLYADNSSCWTSATDFYDNAGKTANCGDTTCLLKVFFDCIGVPSCGVHIDGHFFNAIQINGTWEIIDGVRINNQTCGFADGSGYTFGNPYPCNSYTGDSDE